MVRGRMNIIIGGQMGSEAKGKMSAYLVRKFNLDVLAIAASPNAGHTVYDSSGHKYISHHIPAAAVGVPGCQIYLGPSSVINVHALFFELDALDVKEEQVHIHPRAAIVSERHVALERAAVLLEIGSTNQGVGAARWEKLMRMDHCVFADMVPHLTPMICDTVLNLNQLLDKGETVLCEMTQGFGLDLEHGAHPQFCTSKMINPAMALAEAGVSPKFLGHVYGVIRPYPIRVNNREGYSGPCPGSKEITWEGVRVRCGAPDDITEITSTTNLPRRIFEFSWAGFEHFCQVCRPDYLCLQFANYLDWSVYQKTDSLSNKVLEFIAAIESFSQIPVAYVGTGEQSHGMVVVGNDRWRQPNQIRCAGYSTLTLKGRTYNEQNYTAS